MQLLDTLDFFLESDNMKRRAIFDMDEMLFDTAKFSQTPNDWF